MIRSVRHVTVTIAAASLLAVGFAAAPATAAEAALPDPVINEFSVSTTGTDVEYVELLAPPGADLSGYRVLEVEGDAGTGSPFGLVDEIISFGAVDVDGRVNAPLAANALENGTLTLLLVRDFVGALGNDLDVENDGVLDAGLTVVDAVAVNDGGVGDLTYTSVTLGVAYDGLAFAPGGASRIPDGTDTDATGDWVRNDFDLAGIPGFTGTPVEGEALNTPGAENAEFVPPPADADCEAPIVSIGSVQGASDVSPAVGDMVDIEGVVVGDFQTGGFDGYYLQDSGDADPATSDGIFVHAPDGLDVAVGDEVHVVGTVSESFGLTAVGAADAEVCATGLVLPEPTAVELPAGGALLESLEGMRVTLPQDLAIIEYFNYDRFGEIVLGVDRQLTPTAVYEPGSSEAVALREANLAERITLDDARGIQNPDPAIHPNGAEFTLDNLFRGGDLVTNATGILDWRFNLWRVQPTEGADFTAANPRPEVPEVGGNMTVASFNVLNYFTSIGEGDAFRGANTQEEFDRQEAKIVAALAEIDADVVGLIEIENNGDLAVSTLVNALNDVVGAGTYDFISTGPLGTDAITTALIYKPAEVAPAGQFAVLTEVEDPRFNTDLNRPALAQTFTDVETGGEATVVVNHLKSKGSACAGDPDTGDGQGNCNITRTLAAQALADWLASDPTGQGAGNELVIGDLNSYDKEDPIDALRAAGYTDLLLKYQGEEAYSYLFEGQLGYLDYALAGTELVDKVTGAEAWHINSDEPDLIDYDMSFKQPAQDALFAADPYRSSDHDPVVVGLDFKAPELTVTAAPSVIFPPDSMWRTVTFDIEATDDSGGEVSVEIVDTTATGAKKADIRKISDTEVQVRARRGAVYTVTFEATDPSGNVTTEVVTIRVVP